jgi:hypothetical protein
VVYPCGLLRPLGGLLRRRSYVCRGGEVPGKYPCARRWPCANPAPSKCPQRASRRSCRAVCRRTRTGRTGLGDGNAQTRLRSSLQDSRSARGAKLTFVAALIADLRFSPLRPLAANGVANSVQRMLILSVGHPIAGRVRCPPPPLNSPAARARRFFRPSEDQRRSPQRRCGGGRRSE